MIIDYLKLRVVFQASLLKLVWMLITPFKVRLFFFDSQFIVGGSILLLDRSWSTGLWRRGNPL